ncbi:hypothetical protein IW261DRAFT_1423235 [Armillaria novae-zelandiae]|uniref:Uncharacterized protein n=1 Tax=Armillaria novae-zelandiae TaxID=153914 RepID=A0AA39TYY4_9AGAR|nr:hypothetical protein IW261DRAFT_1423235 [Armillaria novae-zelandiae]
MHRRWNNDKDNNGTDDEDKDKNNGGGSGWMDEGTEQRLDDDKNNAIDATTTPTTTPSCALQCGDLPSCLTMRGQATPINLLNMSVPVVFYTIHFSIKYPVWFPLDSDNTGTLDDEKL